MSSQRRWYQQPRWRKPLLVGLPILIGLVCMGIYVGLWVLVLHHPADDPGPYITGFVIGAASSAGVGVVQPWGERRRQQRDRQG